MTVLRIFLINLLNTSLENKVAHTIQSEIVAKHFKTLDQVFWPMLVYN